MVMVMVNVDLYSAIITKVSNALNKLVSGEKPGFQALSEGLIVLLCAEVVRQRVPDHGALYFSVGTEDMPCFPVMSTHWVIVMCQPSSVNSVNTV